LIRAAADRESEVRFTPIDSLKNDPPDGARFVRLSRQTNNSEGEQADDDSRTAN